MNDPLPRAVRIAFAVVAQVLFWGWSVLAGIILWFGLGPQVLFDVVLAAAAGVVDPVFVALTALLMVLPVAAMLLGWVLRRDPGRLLTLFFGVEVPVLVVALVRLFALQELNPAVAVLMAYFGVGALTLAVVVARGARARTRWGGVLLVGGMALYAVVATWLAGVALLIMVPVTFEVLDDGFRYVNDVKDFVVRGFMLLSVAALVLSPLALFGLTTQALRLVIRAAAQSVGAGRVWLALALFWTVAVGGWMHLCTGHAAEAWVRSEDPREAMKDPDGVRAGLLDAYLWQARYLADDRLGDEVGTLWDEAIGLELGGAVGAVARFWLDPVIYDGVDDAALGGSRGHSAAAAARYAEVFDVPIARAEGARIRAALRHSWRWWSAQARVLDVGAEHVWLESQEVSLQKVDGVGVVTVHDVYRNRTFRPRELEVYFTLPPEAVVTGVWLADSADRSEAFVHQVAPRGAAQQVYREEVRRGIDPALVEQVGPQQYRLRVFPVLPREGDSTDSAQLGSLGPAFHLWLEVTVLPERQVDGRWRWPVPKASEVRGMVWDADTQRSVDGVTVTDPDAWVSPLGPLSTPVRAVHGAVRLPLSGLPPIEVDFTPLWTDAGTASLDSATAVLVDTTASMRPLQSAVLAAVDALEVSELWCLDFDGVRPCSTADLHPARFAGSRPLVELLRDAAASTPLRAAAGWLVLTDASTFDAAVDGPELPAALPPTALVHLDGLPLAYADAVTHHIAHGGGAFTSVHAARRHLAGLPHGSWAVRRRVAERPDTAVQTHSAPVLALVAAAEVRAQTQNVAELNDLAALDHLQGLAVWADIVTPVSSMIVLVDRRQKERLAALSTAGDRFKREVDSGVKGSGGFALNSAPEPTTWVLLGLAAVGLGAGRRRRRGGHSPIDAPEPSTGPHVQ